MTHFRSVLARLERQLEVPYPERRELLDELRGHLEGLHETFLAEGLSTSDAERRAIDAMCFDVQFVDGMGEVHRSAVV